MEQISAKAVVLSEKGGSLHFVRDGEVLASVAIPAGRVSLRPYAELAPEGASIALDPGLVPLQPRKRGRAQKYGKGSHESGANPDFRPTSASRLEKEMRLTMAKMQATQRSVEARLRALQKIEIMPRGPGLDQPVIEAEPPKDPAPSPLPPASSGQEPATDGQ